MSPTLNYTSSVPVGRTVSEIQTMLAKHGASSVATQYDGGRPSGISFLLPTPHGDRAFVLPVKVDAVHRLLVEQSKAGKMRKGYASLEQAERTAWRVIKDWLAAQLAIIEAQMAELDQVMLPYLVVGELPEGGPRSLYAAYRERESLALGEGGGFS